MTQPRVLALLFVLVLAGCGQEEPGQRNTNASRISGIINGSSSHDPSVVLYGCTATIVGPKNAGLTTVLVNKIATSEPPICRIWASGIMLALLTQESVAVERFARACAPPACR